MRVAKLAINQGMEVRVYTFFKSKQKSGWQQVYRGDIFSRTVFSFSVCSLSKSILSKHFKDQMQGFFVSDS